jgi:hypothetical protein
MENSYKILLGKTERRNHMRWEDNIKMVLKELG